MKVVADQATIFEILPVQPSCEQKPAHLVRPLLITINFPSFIGPYVLHFRQKPSYDMIWRDFEVI